MRLTRGVRASQRRRTGSASAAVLLAGAVVGALLTGCAEPGPSASAPRSMSGEPEWVPFGPFERASAFAGTPGLPGPAEISVPGVGVVRLDAAELLPDERIESQIYSYTFDEKDPMVAGLVQFRETDPDGTERYVTHALGISATREPRVATRTQVFSGAPHTSELAGTSELGVIAVFLEGELRSGEGVIQQLAGIDVARGTWVWAKEGGYPVYGEGTAQFYAAAERHGCVESVEEFEVGSGRTIATDSPRESGSGPGECLRLSATE